jgi:hypothetical protein
MITTSFEREGYWMEKKSEIEKILVSVVGDSNISSEVADLIPYTKDSYSTMMGRNIPLPDFVVLPKTEEEVQQIVRLANEFKFPIYPRSFGVNIAGSALPYAGGVVIDLKRMDRILEINEETMSATIEPGVAWGTLRKEANKKGLDIIPIAGPYQVGPVGNFLLTNITPYSSKYCCDRAVALRIVLPNGEILRTGSWASAEGGDINPYFRWAYGPDVAGMFRGSLGNYGIITTMIIRLRKVADVETIVYYGFDKLEPCIEAYRDIERLEIPRHNWLMSRSFVKQLILSPHKIYDADIRERWKKELPPFMISFGFGGTKEMVALYEKIAADKIREYGGEIFTFSNTEEGREGLRKMNEIMEGGSRGILNMYAPMSGFAAVIGCAQIKDVPAVYRTVSELVKKYNLRDAVSGESLEHELLVYSYERASMVYVEQEILYDPAGSQEDLNAVMGCLRECYRQVVSKYGAAHTMPNKSMLKMMVPAYADILKGFKKMVDPNNIMLPGGPYSLE